MHEDLTYLSLIYGDLNNYRVLDKVPTNILVSAYKKCFPVNSLEDNDIILNIVSYYYNNIETNYNYDSFIKYKKYLTKELIEYHKTNHE